MTFFYPISILRLKNRFDNLFRKYITYTGGEELFGLPVTQYPQLLDIKKQLILLQKLYGLYNTVIETVNGYYDILWADINIENINNELLDFQTRSFSLPLLCSVAHTLCLALSKPRQIICFWPSSLTNRCRKLPSAMKEWQAFLDLRKTIDDFNECCPLLELMSNRAMMTRHWKRITEVGTEMGSKQYTQQLL